MNVREIAAGRRRGTRPNCYDFLAHQPVATIVFQKLLTKILEDYAK
ncbi:MAG: hypothetical protein ACYS76_05245 [Planctomycetota bacterium]